jgi:hypothetical protein
MEVSFHALTSAPVGVPLHFQIVLHPGQNIPPYRSEWKLRSRTVRVEDEKKKISFPC